MLNFWRRVRCIAEACLRREGLAFLAFVASVGGGVVLTAMLAWNIRFLQGEHRTDEIALLSYGLLVLLGLMMMSLHRLLGSKQAIELEFWKLKASISNGDDDA